MRLRSIWGLVGRLFSDDPLRKEEGRGVLETNKLITQQGTTGKISPLDLFIRPYFQTSTWPPQNSKWPTTVVSQSKRPLSPLLYLLSFMPRVSMTSKACIKRENEFQQSRYICTNEWTRYELSQKVFEYDKILQMRQLFPLFLIRPSCLSPGKTSSASGRKIHQQPSHM